MRMRRNEEDTRGLLTRLHGFGTGINVTET